MWSLLPRNMQVLLIGGASILTAWGLAAGFDIFAGVPSTPFKWISLSVFIVGVVIASAAQVFWFRFLSKWPWLQSKTFPDLNGIWKGTLISTWIDPVTTQPRTPIAVTITIKQTLWSTRVLLETDESRSTSEHEVLEAFPDLRKFRIWYSYDNAANAQVHHRSPAHKGVSFLDLDWDVDRNRLVGRYYTDRKTTGDIDVRRVPA